MAPGAPAGPSAPPTDPIGLWLTLAVVLLVLAGMFLTRARPHVLLMAAATLLLSLGVIDDRALLEGMANPGVATIAALFGVVAGVRETGAMAWAAGAVLGRPSRPWLAQLQLCLPVATLSAFMNNIPLVAMTLSVASDWSKKIGVPPSRLLMPVSFAAILGGCCTLVGTSTTLVINGLLLEGSAGSRGLGMFDLARVGVPCALAGLALIIAGSRWLLRERTPPIALEDDPRQYTMEMSVAEGSPIADQSIEQAGLRHLRGAFLVRIERGDEVLHAVGPDAVLRAGDRLVFAGVSDAVLDLQKIRGLSAAGGQRDKLASPALGRAFVEVVVSDTCPVVGRSIRDGRFRNRYDAVVIALARSGQRLDEKLGDVVLRPGDTLLLEAGHDFASRRRHSRDFYLVSRVLGNVPMRHDRAVLALGIVVLMALSVAVGWLSMLHAALLATAAMVAARCCTANEALRSIDVPVLLTLVGALGLGRALRDSGAAQLIASQAFALDDPFWALSAFCGTAMVLTNLVNSNAAAVLMFPVGAELSRRLGVDSTPFAVALVFGAGCSFATPIGYQTNLMVMGPGGYRPSDFLRAGAPLSLVVWGVVSLLVPRFWPL